MPGLLNSIREYLLDIFWPACCLNCGKEGTLLCEDCQALIDIPQNTFCPGCKKVAANGQSCPACRVKTGLNGLYFAAPYQDRLVKKMICRFKYEPFLVKELAKTLSALIITQWQAMENKPYFLSNPEQFVLIPVPLHKKRLKWRGFNQAEELAKELAAYIKMPWMSDGLLKIRETFFQTDLTQEERHQNTKGAFVVRHPERIKGQKIILVDDVYTSGATMSECAGTLRIAGAKEVWGVAVARE